MELKGKIIKEGTRPTAAWISVNNIPTHLGTGVIGITDKNVYIAQVAALKAQENPYAVTDLSPLDV